MKKIILFIALSLIFSTCSLAEADDYDAYCGTITKVNSKQLSKNGEAKIVFKEMNSFSDEESSYTRQLTKKQVTFTLSKNSEYMSYPELLELAKFSIGKSSQCIYVDKKTKKVVNIAAGD